jgi:peptide/nickel transport system ATP-binding protein
MGGKLLEIKDLHIHYVLEEETVYAVNGLNFSLEKGESIGIVGETGAGKTTTALAIMGLIPNPPGRIIRGSIMFEGQDVTKMSEAQLRNLRGNKISMVFQDPMTALNPVLSVGDQIEEVILLHNDVSRVEAREKAIEMLEMVGIPCERHLDYPHQFSGGMRQRVVIAMALACNPNLLIADEPTTALDVTIQAQVLELMQRLRKEHGTAMIMITHDLGIVAKICDKVAIVYAGEIVELGSKKDIFTDMKHPYTVGLFNSIPDIESDSKELHVIEGAMPDPSHLPEGCKFYPRCPDRTDVCKTGRVPTYELTPGHIVSCVKFDTGGSKCLNC